MYYIVLSEIKDVTYNINGDRMNKNRLGEIIKRYKLEHNLSTRKLAEKTSELSESYWNDLIKGEKRNGQSIVPSINTLKAVAKTLDISLQDLLFEMGEIDSKSELTIQLSDAIQILKYVNDICDIAHLPVSFSKDEMTDIQIMKLAERIICDFEIYSFMFK